MVTENEDIISKVQLGKVTITLLGTAHVSKESVALVEEKINILSYKLYKLT